MKQKKKKKQIHHAIHVQTITNARHLAWNCRTLATSERENLLDRVYCFHLVIMPQFLQTLRCAHTIKTLNSCEIIVASTFCQNASFHLDKMEKTHQKGETFFQIWAAKS